MTTFGVSQVDDLLQMESVELGANSHVHVITMIADITWEDFKAVMSASYDIAELTVTYIDDEGDRICINSAEEFKALVQLAWQTEGSPLQLVLQPGDVSCTVLLQFPDLLQVRPAAASLQTLPQSCSAQSAQDHRSEATANLPLTRTETSTASVDHRVLEQSAPAEVAPLPPFSSQEASAAPSSKTTAEVTSEKLCQKASKEEEMRQKKRSWSSNIEDMIRHVSKELSKVKRATKRREQPEPPEWFTAYMHKFSEHLTQEVSREAARRTIKQIFKAKPKLQEQGEPLPEVLQMAPPVVQQPTSCAADVLHRLHTLLIHEGSYPDRMFVAPGEVILRYWIVQNSGRTAWPDNTKLVYLYGNMTPEAAEIAVGGLPPGDVKNVVAYLTAPVGEGPAQSHWCLQTGSSSFGDSLCCNVMVTSQPLTVDRATQTSQHTSRQVSQEVCAVSRSRTSSAGRSSDSDFVVLPIPHVVSLSGLSDSEGEQPDPELDRDVTTAECDSFLRPCGEAAFSEEAEVSAEELRVDKLLHEQTNEGIHLPETLRDEQLVDEAGELCVEPCFELLRVNETRADVLESTYHSLPGTPRASPLLSPGTPLSRSFSVWSLDQALAGEGDEEALAAHCEEHERVVRATQEQLQEALTQLESCSLNHSEVDSSSFPASGHVADGATTEAVAAAQQALAEAYGRAQRVMGELQLPVIEQDDEREVQDELEEESERTDEEKIEETLQEADRDSSECTVQADGSQPADESDGSQPADEADSSQLANEADSSQPADETDSSQHVPATRSSWDESEPWYKPSPSWNPAPAWLPKSEAWQPPVAHTAQAPWVPPTHKWMPPAPWLPSPAVAKAMVPPLVEPSPVSADELSSEPKSNATLNQQVSLASECSQAHVLQGVTANVQPALAPASTYPTQAPIISYPSQAPISSYLFQAPVNTYPSQAPVSTYPSQAPISTYPSQAPISTYPSQAPISTYPSQVPVRAPFSGSHSTPVHYPPAGYPQLSSPCAPVYHPQPTYYPMQLLSQPALPSLPDARLGPNAAHSLSHLRDMGFLNDARNLHVLQQCNFDLNAAIARLLQ